MLYECTFMVYQGLSGSEVENLMSTLSDLLSSCGSEVVRSEFWGLRDLAYNVKKHKKAYYFMFYVKENKKSSLSVFESKLKLNELVIRYLFLKVDQMSPQGFFLSKNSENSG